MDPILVAKRLPKLGERAMRGAIITICLKDAARRKCVSRRALVDDALIRFEALIQRVAGDGIRPALLFGERDRIVKELERFMESRLAMRLFAVHRRDVIALGRDAGGCDAIVRGRRGALYGVVFRRLARDGRRLETMRAIRSAASEYAGESLGGVLVYDFAAGTVRTLRCGVKPVELSAA